MRVTRAITNSLKSLCTCCMHDYTLHTLYYGCINGNIQHVQIVISLDVDVTADRSHALYLAASYSPIAIVKYLLAAGCTDTINDALKFASAKGRTDIVLLLLSSLQYDQHAINDAYLAARRDGRTDTVNVLAAAGARIIDPMSLFGCRIVTFDDY